MNLKKRILPALLAWALLCPAWAASAGAEEPAQEVSILFTHDLHSRLEEYKVGNATYGGFGRLKTEIEKKKAENPATFVLDGGDFSMGTLYQTVFETQAAELTMMGRLGFDATTFGNHEFDYRAEGVVNMLNSAVENGEEDETIALPQFLIANIDWEKNTDEGDQEIRQALEAYGSKEYTIIERGGARIGVYGVVGEDAASNAPESGIEFDGIVEASKRIVAELEKEEVDVIVCLSHSGTDEDQDKSEDEILAKEVPEIDVIISGHTHTVLEEPLVHGNTVVASAGCYGQYLGEITLVPDGEGRWELEEYALVPMDGSVGQDEEITAYLEEYKAGIDEEYLEQFGYTADDVLAENPTAFEELSELEEEVKEARLGNLISDSYVYAVKQAEGEAYEPITLAVVPAGVIRDTFAEGEITVADAFNVSSLGIGADRIVGYPLVSVYLTGAELKTVAEIDVSVSTLMSAAQLYPSGMKWAYNPNRLILNRVTEVGITADRVGEEEAVWQDVAEEPEDGRLYRVVAGLYSAQMLGAVEDMSKGILKVTPKDRHGEVITDFEQHIIKNAGGTEVKEWYALASYLESFPENGDGVPVIPERYAQAEGRKVLQDTKNIVELLKNPNKIALALYGIIAVPVLLAALATRAVIKRRKTKRA